jgi:CHAD domain-containing protein
MSYRLSLADELSASVRAVAREQLQGAVEQLESRGADQVRAIHEARKHLKKTRALLRLVRSALGRATYRRENDALRDVAAQLSATRDADVLVATVDALAQRGAGRLPADDFAALRAALMAEAEAAHVGGTGATTAPAPTAAGAPADTAAAAAQELRAAHGRVEEWPLEGSDWETVVDGISRAYARGFREREIAEAEPTVQHLHDWRKRVKDLWYHHRLLQQVWPAVMEAYGEEAHVLSEQLGDDHDLAVLHARLERGVELPASAAADLEPLLALVDERRAELQAAARQIAMRLYAESPKAFERRLRAWIDAAAVEAAA